MIINNNINICGKNIFQSSFNPFATGCCGNFMPGCFDFGYGSYIGDCCSFGRRGVECALAFSLGFAAAPLLPSLFNGIGKLGTWCYDNILAPAGKFIGNCASFVWNKALVPAGEAVWNGIKAVGKGIKNLWNKIF